jgi:hypothetical protein
MKKIIFLVLLATLLVVPAYAAVVVNTTVVQKYVNGEWVDTDRVIISYDVNGEPNHIRAFGLDAQLYDHNGSSPNVVDYNSATISGDYWVYPGSIDINEAGAVNDVGTPIADICDLPSDTLPGLDSNGVTIEMGSLYVGPANEPCDVNNLIEIVVDDDCNVIISENFSRGGVVSEGAASKADPCLPSEKSVRIAPKNAAVAAQWRSVGKPKCWLKFNNPRQCHGDADGQSYGKGNWWVSDNDQQVVNAAWELPYANLVDANGSHKRVFVSGVGNVPLICADFDHSGYGKAAWRVADPDQIIVNANWESGATPANCDP